MSQLCPVCKARLWSDQLVRAGQLNCPRCGAVFRSTNFWRYFRLSLFIVVVLCLVIVVFLTRTNLWLFVSLVGMVVLFWFLPRLINLQRIFGEIRLPEGPLDAEEMKLRLGDENQKATYKFYQEETRFRRLIYFLIALILLLLVVTNLGQGS